MSDDYTIDSKKVNPFMMSHNLKIVFENFFATILSILGIIIS